jgi:hypothetical protein
MGKFIVGLLFLPVYMLVTEAIDLYNRGLKIPCSPCGYCHVDAVSG